MCEELDIINDEGIRGDKYYKYTCIHAGSSELDVYADSRKKRNQSLEYVNLIKI